jgi:chromate reductase, NAD(P)H dehydrogenase (quinone)
MADLNIVVVCGSLRKGSYNAALARQLPKLAPAGMKMSAAPSFAAFPLYDQDIQDAGVPPAVDALAAAIRGADGVVIVSPEYNWSIPGPLKNAIDWVSKLDNQPFYGKPVAIQSVSTGPVGGARMQYHLRQALTSVETYLFGKPEIFVNNAAQKFAKDTLELTDVPTVEIVKKQLAAFEAFARKMTGKG